MDFAPITSALNDLPSFYNPHMMGDWHSIFARQRIFVLGTQTTTTIDSRTARGIRTRLRRRRLPNLIPAESQ